MKILSMNPFLVMITPRKPLTQTFDIMIYCLIKHVISYIKNYDYT